jgi:predicted DCC family thiol-disulfide oxidoreductase YuxK
MADPQILYNGECPVCSAGINKYRRIAATGDDRCGWIDVTQVPEALTRYGLDLEAVKYRIHIVDPSGKVLKGIPACAAIWDEIPRFRWRARLVRLPIVKQLAALAYEILAAVLYAWNKQRDRRRLRATSP